ncbi:hypothetical protein LTS18_009880, partial [Coniosporium uncinatum]
QGLETPFEQQDCNSARGRSGPSNMFQWPKDPTWHPAHRLVVKATLELENDPEAGTKALYAYDENARTTYSATQPHGLKDRPQIVGARQQTFVVSSPAALRTLIRRT